MDPLPFKLVIEDDEGKRTVVPVDLGEVSVGRLEGNTIRLNERNVSRHHARLVRNNGKVLAEDLDSYNGVFINGERIQGTQQVHEGDLVRIGDFQLELKGEGLKRRAEETTQRTVMPPDLDATQPGIRMEDVDSKGLTDVTQVEAEPEARAEPTAIIRLDKQDEGGESGPGAPSTISGERPRLICVSTQLAGREYDIVQTEVVLGRTEDNTIQVDHRSVSRHHAKIVVSGRSYKIIDLNSANGTLVNGEQYAQLSLKAGDLIELGHVKFRFVPPGSSYTLTADEQASVRNAMQGGGTGPLPAIGGRGTSAWDAIRTNPIALAAMGAVLAGLLIVVALVVTSDGDAQPTTEFTTPVTGPTPASTEGAAERLMAKARDYKKQRQWSKAINFFKVVMDRYPLYTEQAIEETEDAELEKANQERYDAANRAIRGENWDAAWNSLNEVPEDSVYAREAAASKDQVRSALVAQRVGQARQAIDDALALDGPTAQGQLNEASGLLDEIESIDPSAVVISGLKEKLADARQKVAARTKAKAKPLPKPQKGTRVRPRPTPPPPSKNVPPPTKTPGVKEDPKELYKQGIDDFRSGSNRDAIKKLSKCVQVDRSFCLCYRALGIVHARGGDGKKAARYYKLYLKYCPNARDAEEVKKLLADYETR